MTDRRFAAFKKWMGQLLEKRALPQPDGRPLFQYRLTTAEFDELEKLLRHWLGLFAGAADLNRITRVTGFPALFVLYSAEWWRRRYDGSGFSWEPILHDLGTDPDGWTPSQRSECVKKGLAEWRLKPREAGGLRFLGSVALQGGLPMRMLSEARGSVGAVLQRVLQMAGDRQVSQPDLLTWIQSLQIRLPKSYRQDTVYALLRDIVWVVLSLKQEADLSPQQDAVALLERKVPNWKERFPLPLEDRHAHGLMEQLVKDAARIKARKVKSALPVQRMLERCDNGNWRLTARIELPVTLEARDLAGLFAADVEALPRTATLSLLVGESRFDTAIRRLAGQSCYRVETSDWETNGHATMQPHRLRLAATDGRVWFAEAPFGGELDSELPWVFSAEEPYHLLKQGGGSVALTEVWLVLPEGWRIPSPDVGPAAELAVAGSPVRSIWKVRGAVQLESPKGKSLPLRSGQADAKEMHFIWTGDRFWLDFKNPSLAFRGMPQLYRTDDEGVHHPVNGRCDFQVIGAAPHAREIIGPMVASHREQGGIQHRTRMVLLPAGADLKLESYDARSGVVRFCHWNIGDARVIGGVSVRQNNRIENGDLLLEVAVNPGDPVPASLLVEIAWRHTTHRVRLLTPFPAQGIRAFDGARQELCCGERLALQQLLGLRLVLQNAGRPVLQIGTDHRRSRRFRLNNQAGALSLEISLVDYLGEIQQLLSMEDAQDVPIPVFIFEGGLERFKLYIARYSAVLERDANRVVLKGDRLQWQPEKQLAELKVMAMRLEHPEDEPVLLRHRTSEGVAAAAWDFEPERREPGSWLIYPAPEFRFPVRSTLWSVPGETLVEDALAHAIGEPDPEKREACLAPVIDRMAEDYCHPSWVIVEQLAAQVGHLPLATLDLWRCFAHSSRGMAALALRLGCLPKGFWVRFADELPFSWEAVPFRCWKGAIQCLDNQCFALYDVAGKTVLESHLDARRKELCGISGALHYLLGLASAEFDERMQRESTGLKAMGAIAEKKLFAGEESELMKLLRNHAEDEWPTGFDALLEYAVARKDISCLLCSESFGFHDGIINMPLLVAARAACDNANECFQDAANVDLLRIARSFDPDWFDEAYNMTIARCWAQGLMKG